MQSAELAALREQVAEHERRISAHERALASAFEYAGVAVPGGFPARDRHGLHTVDGPPGGNH